MGPKICVIGAGSNVFGLRMIKDIASHSIRENSPLKDTELFLMDIDEQRLEYMYQIATKIKERYPQLPITFKQSSNRRDALKGAKTTDLRHRFSSQPNGSSKGCLANALGIFR